MIGNSTVCGSRSAGSGQQAAARPGASLGKKIRTGSVFDVLLWAGQIEFHQHAAALAYAKLRRKSQSLDFPKMQDAFPKQHAVGSSKRRSRGAGRKAQLQQGVAELQATHDARVEGRQVGPAAPCRRYKRGWPAPQTLA